MKHLKSLIIGAGVALFNIATAFTQVFRPERCTGSCGSCGLSCGQAAIGLVGIGAVAIFWSRLKGKFYELKAKFKYRIN